VNRWSQIALLFSLCLFAGKEAVGNPLPQKADVMLGKKIFETHCKVCHGVNGDGATFAANALNPPPRNFTTEKSRQELTLERMQASVSEGREGTAMMPWAPVLSKLEIHSTVLYIRKRLMNLPE
jgi:mono/diheme cytochrome c family protein